MIRSIAELAQELATAGADTIDATGVKRPEYIGDMYEGLAGGLLTMQFPEGLGLSLVEGFLVGQDGKTSDQKDWVLVQGDVERLPFSDHHRIPLWQAVAVFEIKKSFRQADLNEYFEKVARISDLYKEFPARWNEAESATARVRGYRPHFESDPYGFGEAEEHFKTSLLEDVSLPLRIGIGFHGPVKWGTFRDHCAEALQTEAAAAALHPLPSLVLNGSHALVKTNGTPFTVHAPDNFAVTYATSHGNPWFFLAKLLWWRIIAEHGYRWPAYADDDEPEDLVPLTVVLVPEKKVGLVELDADMGPGQFGLPEPVYKISAEAQGLVMTLHLVDQQWFAENDESLVEAYSDGGPTLAAITEELIATGLFRRGRYGGETVIYQVPPSLGAWVKPGGAYICDDTFNRAVRAQAAERAAMDPGKTLHIMTHDGMPVAAYEYELGFEDAGRNFEHLRVAMMLDAAQLLADAMGAEYSDSEDSGQAK